MENCNDKGNINREREMLFVKLIRKGPHVLEFSDDYLMVHNGRIAIATPKVLELYREIKSTEDVRIKNKLAGMIAELIDKEYYRNNSLEWYDLREYIGNFSVSRLEELKKMTG